MKIGTLVKAVGTMVGAVVLTTLGIFASDALRGVDGNLGGLTGDGIGICKGGAVPLRAGQGTLCVDVYEASPGQGCPHQDPKNILDSEENAADGDCYAASTPGKNPWRYISLPQAQKMCAGARKRLPTSDEWYHIALGTDATKCILDESEVSKTKDGACVSSAGAYDTVGNVWEWVDETVTGLSYNGRSLPSEGYVTSVDASGVAITSGTEPDVLFGEDYVWTKSEGVFGMIRGGFYGSGSDGGMYTVNASVPTTFAAQGVGFRCVEDIF
jgi:formylglycine-generating enzyme required for sulfatase activity